MIEYPLKPAPVLTKIFSKMCFKFQHCVVVLPSLQYKGKLIFKFILVPESILQLFRICSRTAFAVICALLLFSNAATAAPDGKALFTSNCASCHNPLKDATGPALKGINATFPTKEWGYNWVHNSAAVIASGDKMANEMYNKFGKAAMTAFPQLKNEEIDAIFAYVNSVEAPKAVAAAPTGDAQESSEGNGYLYTIITLSLLVLVVILWRANQGLSRTANDKEGVPNEKEIPLYRNKVVIAMVAIVAFIMAGYWLVNGAINEGRQQNYKPLQPIYYSHKVHAGINQINCLYCHASAEKSKHSMIPSTNVCMNCHKQINEYTGEKDHQLKTAEGKVINGTEEIKKLYEYAGWDPVAKKYKLKADGSIDAKPIQWVKIHNLPDHVYFNHSQHVKVGKVQCQRCHGEITEMDEVYQYAPLSMGWCINCHRQTQVQFDNDYYSIFAKYREEIKAGKRTGVTVEEMGGTECQKCHY